MRERRGGVAAWIGEWDAGEKSGRGWINEGVGCMGEWNEGERKERGWMDAGVG